ncbi:FG-GAP repeat protein [Gemmata sp. G18]|uniref:FG-GAP repeat protein n=1 Tax=Gemmata palustris TaxID=2822762 RepID=A0ABS5C3A9_9BACT|nr:FG-GAP-like repeat-containing protein [Gemmata palustris]MBP3960474.1 FG-GAP repeat protein [Gemmata palustris]
MPATTKAHVFMKRNSPFGPRLEALESREVLNAVNLTSLALSQSEVNLTWDLTGTADTAVVVERAAKSTGTFQTLTVLPSNENTFTDTSGWAGTAYNYRVRTLTAAGPTPYTAVTVATTQSVPSGALAQVTTLRAVATSSTTAAVSFTDPNTSDTKRGYILERSADGVSYQVIKSLLTSTTWVDKGLTPGATYSYRVRGYSWNAPTSDYSAPAAVTLSAHAAGIPREPSALGAVANAATSVTISWTNNDSAGTRFKVERAVYDPYHTMTWTQIGLTAPGVASFTDTGTAAERAYVYRVRATSGAGDSGYATPSSEVMYSIFGTEIGVVTPSAGTGAARVYDIGPGQKYQKIADLDWSKLGPGDTVNIHYKAGGYHELFQISTRGTASAGITINGIPDPVTGALPVIDGYQAVLAPQFVNSYAALSGAGAVVVGVRPGYAVGYKPGYITIQNLQIQNAYQGNADNTFTDYNGTKKVYGRVGAGIYLERAENVTIKGCTINDNGQGVYGAGQSGFDRLMMGVTLDGNYIYGNGNIGSDRQHNTYLEGVDTLYQNNRYGPLRSGALGAGLKDRSAGLVIRNNYIEGGAHQLQLPEADNQFDLAITLAKYHQAFVYGNTLVAPPGNAASIVYYGGDGGLTPLYRKGVLSLYNNTLVTRSDLSQVYKIIAVKLATNGETVDARNNIFATVPSTPGAKSPYFNLVTENNNAYFGRNWVPSNYALSFLTFSGHASGTQNLIVGSSGDPGFVSPGNGDYHLKATSTAIDTSGQMAGGASAHPVDREYLDPRTSRPRLVAGKALDLGAFEYSGSVTSGGTVVENVPSVAKFGISAPAAATAGSSFTITVSALTSNGTAATGYRGAVRFTSSDVLAGLPADYTFTAADAGVHTFTITLRTAGSRSINLVDKASAALVGSATLSVAAVGLPYAVGTDAGPVATVTLFNPDGSVRFRVRPFGDNYTGGASVATGDVTGDGVADVVVGSNGGMYSQAVIVDGATGKVRPEKFLGANYTYGRVSVAVGDVTGDGIADIAMGTDESGPHVRVYRGGDYAKLTEFSAGPSTGYWGQTRVALGDLDADGKADLVVSGLYATGTTVSGFAGTSLRTGSTPAALFSTFSPGSAMGKGVFLAIGDVDSDGYGDLVLGAGEWGNGRIVVYSGKSLVRTNTRTVLAEFLPPNADLVGGTRVATRDVNGDGKSDILTTSGDRLIAFAGGNLPPVGTLPPVLRVSDPYPEYAGKVWVG